jgi:hypothetical protein
LLPISGSIVDTVNKRTLILLSQSMSALALITYSLVYRNIGFDYLLPTYLLLICLKCSEQFSQLGLTASVHKIVLAEQVQRFKAIQQFIAALSMLSIPVLSVWLVNRWSLFLLILIEIFCECVSVGFYSLIDFNWQTSTEDEMKEERIDRSFVHLFKEGVDYVKNQPKLILAITFTLIFNFLLGAVNIGLPYLQVHYLNLPDTLYGITESVFALGLLASGIILSIKTIRYPLKNATRCVLLIGASFFIFGFGMQLSETVLAYAIVIICFNLAVASLLPWMGIPVSSWMIQEIPTHLHGRVFQLLNTGGDLFTPLGIFLFSLLFEQFSPYLLFSVIGCIIILFGIIFPILFKVNLQDHHLQTQ